MLSDIDWDAGQANCSICSNLADQEYAAQKYGREEEDTTLPAAVSFLKIVRDFRPNDSRKLQLRQCPACGTYYLYRTDYEYLVNGSEDEEYLVRLSRTQADEYLNLLKPGAPPNTAGKEAE